MNKFTEKHRRVVVLDIEAMTQNNPAGKIATIGAALVDLVSLTVVGTFYVRCGHQQPGREIDESTAAFWEQQRTESPAAYHEVFCTDGRLPLAECLRLLAEFIESGFSPDQARAVMGNGPEYDNVMLTHAYQQLDIPLPWHYGNNQSLRTAVMFGRLFLGMDPKYELPPPAIKHHALHDAEHEANYLLTIAKGFSKAHIALP